MSIWFYVECAFATFLIIVLFGCAIVSLQLTIAKYKQNNFNREMQEETNRIAKEVSGDLMREKFIEIIERNFSE